MSGSVLGPIRIITGEIELRPGILRIVRVSIGVEGNGHGHPLHRLLRQREVTHISRLAGLVLIVVNLLRPRQQGTVLAGQHRHRRVTDPVTR